MRCVVMNISVTVMLAASDVCNERIAKRRESRSKSLGQHDSGDRLQIAHAAAQACFKLPGGNRFECRTDGFGAVGTLVDGKDDYRGDERIDQHSCVRQTVEDDEELHQKRRAACDPDIKAREILQYRHVCVLDERHHNRDDERS